MSKRRRTKGKAGFGQTLQATRTPEPITKSTSNPAMEETLNTLAARKLNNKLATDTTDKDLPPPEEPKEVSNSSSEEELDTSEERVSEETPVPLTQSQVLSIVDVAIEKVSAQHQTSLDAALQQHQKENDEKDAEIERLRKEAQEAKDQRNALSTIFERTGYPEPNNSEQAKEMNDKKTLEVLGPGSDEMRRWEKLTNEARSVNTFSKRGKPLLARNNRPGDEYFCNNRVRVREGIEAILRDIGLLNGGELLNNAITGIGDIPSLSFTYLSALVRQSHFPNLIHWQFANTQLELGTRPGLVIAVPRVPLIAFPTSFSDRVLTTGTPLSTDADPITELNVNITLEELGLGKDASNNPLGFAEFVNAYSMMSVENAVVNNLGHDYAYSKDLGLREQWFRSTNIVYNSGGSVAALPADVGTGDDGTMNEAFLNKLRAYMSSAQLPPYRDGLYGISMNPTDLSNFMTDKGSKERDAALQGRDLVVQMLQASTGQDFGGEVTGYRGAFNGFHIFEQNVYGVGAAGTDPGVNNLTAGDTNNYDFLSSFAFGQGTIAWATGMPAEVRESSDRDFDRQSILTWISHEAPGSLDVEEVPATGEQNRVVQTRCLAKPI